MRVDSSDAASSVVDSPGLDARLLARGLAALRIFVGLIALLNGLAKVFGWHRVHIGPYLANLINRDDARFILDFEVFKNPANSSSGTRLPLVRSIARLMLDHWGLIGWALTLTEVVTGLLLVLGLLTRAAALVALGQHLFLALVYASSDRWLFEQPHEYVPLIILSLVPAGRVWGMDARAAVRSGRGRARSPWPF